MSRRVARPVGIAAVALTIGALSMYPVLLDAVPLAHQPADSGGGFLIPAIVVFALVGALILWHRASHPMGWVYAATGVLLALSGPLTLYASIVTPPGKGLPGVAIVGPASGVAFVTGTLLPITYGLLLFPDGHLPSSRWKPVAWAVPVVFLLMFLGATAANGPALIAAFLGLLALALASFASLFRRFRRSSGKERQQLKWAISAIGLLVATGAVGILGGLVGINDRRFVALMFFALALPPLSVGIAILRHRLYDIDVLINRTLVYGATTATLVATYALGVLAAHAVLRPFTQGSELSVAASTLAVAALIQPIRRRIQSAVDRRFYRSRYDAAQTVDTFALRMRDEVDLDALRAQLLVVARDTMQPAHASVWLRERAR